MLDPSKRPTDDERVMSAFRYKQELRRTLHFFGSFAIAFSFISITTGIFANYGLVLKRSGPAGIWTWPIVTVGQTLVALVFAELAARMPLTGYAYQWVTRLAGSGWGWFTGWVAVCFLIIVVPSVDHGVAAVLGHLLGIPDGSLTLKVIVCATILLQALIHIFGVRLAAAVNSWAVFTEVVGMVGLVLVFAALAVRDRPSVDILLSTGAVAANASYVPAFIMASLMGAYTLVGFESAANLSEETVDASRVVPQAVIGSVVLSGVMGTLFLIVTVLGIDDLAAITNAEYPLHTIIEHNLGALAASLFFVLVTISIFACGLVIMASGSRLIYAMARDRVFPASGLFSRVSPGTSVPTPAVLLIVVFGIVAEVFSDSLQQLLVAAAVLPALIYLLTVVAYRRQRHKMPTQFGSFSLGRHGGWIATAAIVWLILIIAILTLPSEFRRATVVSGVLCAIGALLYLGVFRGRIAQGRAGTHAMNPESPPQAGPLENQDASSPSGRS